MKTTMIKNEKKDENFDNKDKRIMTKIKIMMTNLPSPVHLWIPVRAGVLLAHNQVVHQGLSHLAVIQMTWTE